MMEKIRLIDVIADADIIEAIRANMPVATMEKAGLMSASQYKNWIRTTINIEPNNTLQIQNVLGMVILCNKYISNCEVILCNKGVTVLADGGYNVDYSYRDNSLYITSKYTTSFTAAIVYQYLIY